MYLNNLQSKKHFEPSSFDDTRQHLKDNSYKKEETPAKSYSYHFDSNETFGDDDIHRGNNGKYSIRY